MFEDLFTIYFLIWIVPCMIIASAKNKSVGKAFVASLFFGFFALVYYIFVSSEPSKEKIYNCIKCGIKTVGSEKYCSGCGAKFVNKEEWLSLKCPNCETYNKKSGKYCTKCGHNLAKKIEPGFNCEYCNKKFKSDELVLKHYENCEEKIYRDNRNIKIIGIIIFLVLGIYFLIKNKINLIPLILIGFIVTPYFDKLFSWYKKKNKKIKNFEFNWLKKEILIAIIILLFFIISLIIPECPVSCDDNNFCTNDFCSSETGFKCMNITKLNCDGNNICELGEYGKSSDCPNCDDKNKCTADSYDSISKQCIYVEVKSCV